MKFMEQKIILVIGLVIVAATLSACGGGGPSGGAGSGSPIGPNNPGPITLTHNYRYSVEGMGVNFSASIYVNFGAASQVETPVATHVIPSAAAQEYDVTGTDTVAQFVNHSGGLLTVTLYRDGVAVQSKSETNAGASISFNEDI